MCLLGQAHQKPQLSTPRVITEFNLKIFKCLTGKITILKLQLLKIIRAQSL